MSEKLLLNVHETCETLGVSRETLRQMTIPLGDLPCLHLGASGKKKAVRYSRETLAAWIEKREQTEAAPVDAPRNEAPETAGLGVQRPGRALESA